MLGIDNDQPIEGGEASPDRLHREMFAERVAKALVLPTGSPGRVVSLEGEWGYGKTSLINLAKVHLNGLSEEERPIILDFNPWLVGDRRLLIEEFLVELAKAIGSKDRSQEAQKVGQKLIAYAKIFSLLKLIPGAELKATIIEKVLSWFGKATVSIARLKNSSIESKRADVCEALRELDRPIVVIVDDLDRLTPAEAFEMVRLVKAVADFPRTAYLLALDKEYLEATLEQYGVAKKDRYLEKIIQLRLTLPLIDEYDLRTLLYEKLIALPDEWNGPKPDENKDRVAELYEQYGLKRALETPRDLKRIFNRITLHTEGLMGEVHIADMLALETLAVKAPSVYEHIRSNPTAYTGTFDGWETTQSKEEMLERYKKERETALESARSDLHPIVSRLLEFLFPETGSDTSYLSVRGRVAAADRLTVALSYGLPRKEIPASLLERFCAIAGGERREIIDQLTDADRAERFIDKLNDWVQEEGEVTDSKDFVMSLGYLAEAPIIKELREKAIGGFFSIGPIIKVEWVLNNTLKRLYEAERLPVWATLFESGDTLTLSTATLGDQFREYGMHGLTKSTRGNPHAPQKVVEETAEKWKSHLIAACKSRTIFESNATPEAFWLLGSCDSALAHNITSELIEDDETFDLFLKSIQQFGWDNIKGVRLTFDKDLLARFVDLDALLERVQLRKGSSRPIDDRLAMIHESLLSDTSIYLRDGTKA